MFSYGLNSPLICNYEPSSSVINVCVVTLDMSVMFCASQADKGDLLKQKLAPATIQWVFYGFVVNKNHPFLSWMVAGEAQSDLLLW